MHSSARVSSFAGLRLRQRFIGALSGVSTPSLVFMVTSTVSALRAGRPDVVLGTSPPIFQAVSAWAGVGAAPASVRARGARPVAGVRDRHGGAQEPAPDPAGAGPGAVPLSAGDPPGGQLAGLQGLPDRARRAGGQGYPGAERRRPDHVRPAGRRARVPAPLGAAGERLRRHLCRRTRDGERHPDYLEGGAGARRRPVDPDRAGRRRQGACAARERRCARRGSRTSSSPARCRSPRCRRCWRAPTPASPP